ncbi:MAG TPA: phosphoglycerate kinase [Streptosporangiaceae bacterium]|nr:phosphoglycerate kinase [Streptosporangiaceae bacterium]
MKTIDELDVSGKRVLVRLDLNVPLNDGLITDDGKIRASLPTLKALLERNAAVIVCSHLGRPAGESDPRYSLAPISGSLSRLLGRPVTFATDTVGPAAKAAVDALQPGQVVLLENVRFNRGETSKDDAERGEFADHLAALADAYVGDGFGAVHRRHASVCDVAARLPHAAGYLIQGEVAALRQLTASIRRPYTVVLGGAKVADKLPMVEALLTVADHILIGGAMATTFIAATGHPVGTSLLEGDQAAALRYLARARASGVDLQLPADLVVARTPSADGPITVVAPDQIPPDQMAVDIGPETADAFSATLARAETIFWNGPMGISEIPAFAEGTLAVARAIAHCPGFTMVGGGDTAAAVRSLGFTESDFGHISTGGGASLEFLEGKRLPGLAALEADPVAV